MVIQFVPNLDTELTLSPDTSAESIQLLVLLLQHVRVVIMDLLVVEVALIRRPLGLVAVREESSSVGNIIINGRRGDGAVVEADRLGRVGGVARAFQKG